eukprot:CAMPEP_0206444564 /NCGR_PEP_ID=MMETSP0324_2-20121206/14986_1 /ASSEMBLY_ACC=CAM_ASM_000836 /TAXON_ID=2866 /ORGANISM="Crypthecodinium cohnii, Strain Seligo" /LENGTH=1054 /DNA_ID=CAMNT_0053912609 /DNA_START=222 /DNA_END=3386 /DNA_ORIENTATION=+
MAAVRAHGTKDAHAKAVAGGVPGVLGVRREDKNKWERRAPLAPRHVQELVKKGIKVIVQPSTRRVFTDNEYKQAGAILQEDLTECATIAAVKEVPIELLLPGRTWLFFSHTIKAQACGMPLLDAVLQKKVRLVDYECITESGRRGDKRLVAFGNFAGYAGAIDFLRGLGERFLALGYSTPFLHIGSAFMYPSLDEAKRAVSLAGDAIREHGLPPALCPFVAVFTGRGNVTQGALDIFKLLPFEFIDPGDLPKLHEQGVGSADNCRKLYLSIATSEHMVRHKDGRPFDKRDYYAQPDQYEPIFQDAVLPYSTVVINGMYWDARYPRLFTHEDIHRNVMQGHDRLLGVCDITCDADGSVPTRQFTSIEHPFFVYNALSDATSCDLDDPGILFHAVDHLPSELPREASEHFGNCLLEFLPALVAAQAPETPNSGDTASLPVPVRGAVVAEGGALTREYEYIAQLRAVNERSDVEETLMRQDQHRPVGPHGVQAPPACANLEITGHLFDTRFINKVCDLVESHRGRVQIMNIDVGGGVKDSSRALMVVMTHTQDSLQTTLKTIMDAAQEEPNISVRRAGETTSGAGQGDGSQLVESKDSKKILVLGSGFVVGPLIEYLLRDGNNVITVASIMKKEMEALSVQYGHRCQSQYLDVLSTDAEMEELRDQMVKESDVIVSLVPATMHVGVAQLAVKHGKHMVTASYVSEDMEKLHEQAKQAGVVIINEVGLDPGIDHMSAMKMVEEAKAEGSEIIKFSSLCGGLPAPEAAGSSPIGYKFSWSPRGVLTAAKNAAKWSQEGQLKEIPGSELLTCVRPLALNNALALDVLPNRDSISFARLYGLSDAPTFFRGTLRYRGFCERMYAASQLGLLELGPLPRLAGKQSKKEWMAALLETPEDNLRQAIDERIAGGFGAKVGASFIEWLGLLSNEKMPSVNIENPIDVMTSLLQREEMLYRKGERDMVAMYHELVVRLANGSYERRTATLIEYADPKGATAMARTVGVTAAIAARLVLEDASKFQAGVQRPLSKEWYDPMLQLLEDEGIRLDERAEPASAEGAAAL